MQLSDSHVLITGASQGIGAAIARQAAQRGATVTLVARAPDALDAVAQETGGQALVGDLKDDATLLGLVDRAEALAGRPVDVLVNNAGFDAARGMLELSADDVRDIVALNLRAPMELARQAVPGMVARRRGHVVNVSSGFSTVAVPGLTPYSATKAGLSHFTAGLGLELEGTDVGTTLVEPGPVQTQLYDNLKSTLAFDSLRRMMRLGLTAEVDPGELAHAVLDRVESGGGHVVLPRRMTPAMALTWLPRRATAIALTGVARRRSPAPVG